MAVRISFKAGDYITVYTRDSGRCGICGEPVDPADISIDHVHPISRGGAHEPSNWQLAHRRCNARKQARIVGMASTSRYERKRARHPYPALQPTGTAGLREPVYLSEPGADGCYGCVDVARYLKIHRETARKWLREGRIRGIRASDRMGWRIPETEVRRFIAEGFRPAVDGDGE